MSILKSRWIRWLGICLWLLLPLVVGRSPYALHVLIMVTLYLVLAQGLNLVLGLAGQLQLGHAALFGIGAYAAALLMIDLHWSFWAVLLPAAAAAAAFALLVGLPSLRVAGDYLGIVTLGFGEITRLVLINWMDLTRGPMGLPGIPSPELFGLSFNGKHLFFYLITLVAAVSWFVMDRLTVSKFGLELLALRADERVAEALGIRTGRAKLGAFALSGVFAGLAGAFYAVYISFISPDTFLFNDSVVMLAMVVIGGMGSLVGSAIGAAILTVAPELLRFLGDWRLVLYGALLTFMMIYRPSGLWGIERRQRNTLKLTAGG